MKFSGSEEDLRWMLSDDSAVVDLREVAPRDVK